MTNEQLLALALDAIDDADAMEVLQDAVREMPAEQHEPISARVIEEFGYWSATIDARTNARAIAAVLLFGEWPTSWPLAERCWAPTYASRTFDEVWGRTDEPALAVAQFPRDAVGDD